MFSASDNVQTGDVACVTLSVVEDDILEPMVEFLVLFDIDPLVNEPPDAPDFTRVRVIDTTAQGRDSIAQWFRKLNINAESLYFSSILIQVLRVHPF